MAFHVFIQTYGADPVCINPGFGTTARQAIRLLGSYLSGKKHQASLERAYAIGRYGWEYSQRDLKRLIA